MKKNIGNAFLDSFDINKEKATSLSKFYNFNDSNNFDHSIERVYNNPKLKYVYIASNHFTHTNYAVEFLNRNVITYIEKPISISTEQFQELIRNFNKTKNEFFVGYNRPFSKAIIKLKELVNSLPIDELQKSSFSINYFISGHKISSDHWYRNPEEGTRICGNLGHWIDLSIHALSWRNIPDKLSNMLPTAMKTNQMTIYQLSLRQISMISLL